MAERMSAALATADWSGVIVCLTRCYACRFGECPGVPHTWGAPDDFEHAWTTFQDAPGFCGCSCGRPARSTKVRVQRTNGLDYLRMIPGFEHARLSTWSWRCPGCLSGTALSRDDAIAKAQQHCGSGDCRHRSSDA